MFSIFAVVSVLSGGAFCLVPETPVAVTRANYLITATDDFIVDVYENGNPVPDESRHLLVERFGATVERIDTSVHKGDWLVFHVVNNRLRWGGSCYFGVSGSFAENEFGFVSKSSNCNWSVCESASNSSKFIRKKNFGTKNMTLKPVNSWYEGDIFMKQYAGDKWNGEGIWGHGRSIWIKVLVD
ncbi:MAG: hypothetical protein ABJA67_15675 [Chthonomonadales bacterium]